MKCEIKGISYDNGRKKWRARIGYNGINYSLLYSDSRILCVQVRKAAEIAIRKNIFDDFLTKLKKLKEANKGYY